MQYLRFEIADYRAITDTLVVDLEGDSLVPIIGINESGKTTILHAIFAFDAFNDRLLHDGQHLKDTQNLYQFQTSEPPRITAELALTENEYLGALRSAKASIEIPDDALPAYDEAAQSLAGRIRITRVLDEPRRYELESGIFPDARVNDVLGQELVHRAPYTLFFDDFRDSIDELIPIAADDDGDVSGWLAIFQRLFKATDPSLSVLTLAELDDRQRASAVSEVVALLNRTLTREWTRFRLDDDDQPNGALRLAIEYLPATSTGAGALGALKLQVVETTATGGDRYFYLLNRSKGFYWFCNFVLKLEFNPKRMSGDHGAVYLLDEPGSYLHNSAQARLCEKLRHLSQSNTVIYCTHSHYLLNPDVIPLSTIQIASKDGQGNVGLVPYHSHPAETQANRWAHQTVWDALRVKPFLTDLSHRKIVVVEGVTDWYAFGMFNTDGSIGFIPGVNADSLNYIGTLLLGWQVDFCVLWDNDKEGQERHRQAEQSFGARLAKRKFRLLPLASRTQKKRILQDLFAGDDLPMIRRRVGLSPNSKFSRTIEALYYHADRERILADVSAATKQNFVDVLSKLPI